jgi:hypothetical protein
MRGGGLCEDIEIERERVCVFVISEIENRKIEREGE